MLKPIDLNRAAADQYGPGCYAKNLTQHLWSWAAFRNQAQLGGLDMAAACIRQHGPNYIPVYTGVHAYDWAAFDHIGQSNIVIPVLQIAADLFGQIDQIRTAINNYDSAINAAQQFYKLQTGKTFVREKILCQYTTLTASEWTILQLDTLQEATRYKYLDKAQSCLNGLFSSGLNYRCQYLITQFAGFDKNLKYGAANRGNVSVIPPFAAARSVTLDQAETDETARAILHSTAHELGHGLGLAHPDQLSPEQRPEGWQGSIMQWGWNTYPKAYFTQSEKDYLTKSQYLAG